MDCDNPAAMYFVAIDAWDAYSLTAQESSVRDHANPDMVKVQRHQLIEPSGDEAMAGGHGM